MIENKELEFRAWDGITMYPFNLSDIDAGSIMVLDSSPKSNESWASIKDLIVMQYVRLKDKNHQKIYDGDFIRYRHINRHREELPGPLGGMGYLEPFIDEDIILVDNFGTLEFSLFYVTLEYDRETVLDEWGMLEHDWLKEDGDLQYLLDEYNFKNEEELLKYLGCEVIGNYFENPELIEEIDESN